jgi:hypothetical protein
VVESQRVEPCATGDPRFHASQRYAAPYVQDDWKISNDFTVNLGLRYEYQSPWVEKDDQLTFFDTDASDPLTGRKALIRLVGQRRRISLPVRSRFLHERRSPIIEARRREAPIVLR